MFWGRGGPRLQALVASLRYAQHLPVARLLRALHGTALVTGTVAHHCRCVADRRERALAMCRWPAGGGGMAWRHMRCNEFFTGYHPGNPRRHLDGARGRGDRFPTVTGAERFAQVRGLLETARKQGHDLLAVLQPDPVLPYPRTAASGLPHSRQGS